MMIRVRETIEEQEIDKRVDVYNYIPREEYYGLA